MDASIRPKGILDLLSQQEIGQLSDPQNGGLNELFRRCALSVLNSDSQTDRGKDPEQVALRIKSGIIECSGI